MGTETRADEGKKDEAKGTSSHHPQTSFPIHLCDRKNNESHWNCIFLFLVCSEASQADFCAAPWHSDHVTRNYQRAPREQVFNVGMDALINVGVDAVINVGMNALSSRDSGRWTR